jgi:hypothetical protein
MGLLKIINKAGHYMAFERILLELVERASLSKKRSPNTVPKKPRTQPKAPQRLASRIAEVAENRCW